MKQCPLEDLLQQIPKALKLPPYHDIYPSKPSIFTILEQLIRTCCSVEKCNIKLTPRITNNHKQNSLLKKNSIFKKEYCDLHFKRCIRWLHHTMSSPQQFKQFLHRHRWIWVSTKSEDLPQKNPI